MTRRLSSTKAAGRVAVGAVLGGTALALWWAGTALAQPSSATADAAASASASASASAAPAASAAAVSLPASSPDASPAALPVGASLVDRGRYLAAAGDCIACHTQPRSAPFSGGRPVATPFGTVLSANLTPDQNTGIGRYTPDTFYRALHEGVDREGQHLYPAFPYTNYTRVSREDSDAIFAYLQSLPPVSNAVDRNQLKFPFNIRSLMGAWNLLFFDKGNYKPDPAQSAEWNRGAYLVQGLGHCEACHTPRNSLGGAENGKAFQGGRFGDWFAPDITPNKRTGIGSWSREQIVEFLRSGRNVHAGAAGEMAEAVTFSTSKLSDGDLSAITTYLQSLPPSPDEAAANQDAAVMARGGAIWQDACAACHRADGSGVPGMFPPIKGSANAQQRDPTTVLHYILTGAQHLPTTTAPTPFAMPPFAWKLNDAQIADVATFARNSWGNQAPAVKEKEVADLRARLDATQKATPVWPPTPSAGSLKQPNPATLGTADTDSRDNGTPQAGRVVAP